MKAALSWAEGKLFDGASVTTDWKQREKVLLFVARLYLCHPFYAVQEKQGNIWSRVVSI